MKLSARLQKIKKFVTPGSRVCDIGCDHGLLPISLILDNISPFVILVDISEGPLESARRKINKYNLDENCDLRLSNGFQRVDNQEVDTAVISGLGGTSIINILSDGLEKVKNLKELIIEPQSDFEKVRIFLNENKLEILDEELIEEKHKYYPIIKCVYNSDYKKRLSKGEAKYGPVIITKKNKILLEYLLKNKIALKKISKKNTNDNILEELKIVEDLIKKIKNENI